ncbi:hypothetical protein [Flavobacterium akiainvivens]|nr:hypothetical protein [Flavobacterium akiainvivens]SFQ15809.1 hypothetical protein SAMN05444144_101347 [Flavobacterium akiainvivens]
MAQELAVPVRLMANPKPATETFVGTDAFGWQYTIANNEFRKQKDGRVLKYKNVALGDIYRADLQNPLQIVLFYRKFNTVVLLDNQLNETLNINFSNLPNNQPELIVEATGLASQNRLWLYDVTTQQIGLYDTAKNTFRTVTPPFKDGLKFYQSDYNYFYWIDNTGTCYAVNLFGNVTPLGTVPEFKAAQLLDSANILISTAEGLFEYNLPQQSLKKVAVVEKTFGSFYYKDQILSIFTNDQIIQYKIKLP